MPKERGILYLIPSLLSPEAIASMPPSVLKTVQSTHHFFVENERSARRFFKQLEKKISIDDREFSLIDRHHEPDTALLKKWITAGKDVGIVSEAGYPCIADPGNILVRAAHEIKARVLPLSGPNAMLMALSASGFNGQNFSFSGYLPRQSGQRIKALKRLLKKVERYNETQIFMEVPYRNEKFLKDIILHLPDELLLCIAVDITAPTEFIATKTIKEWKNNRPNLHKRPTVFLLGN